MGFRILRHWEMPSELPLSFHRFQKIAFTFKASRRPAGRRLKAKEETQSSARPFSVRAVRLVAHMLLPVLARPVGVISLAARVGELL